MLHFVYDDSFQISKRLPTSYDDPSPLIDRSFIAIYDPNAGFRISVDGANNIALKAIPFVNITFLSKIVASRDQGQGNDDRKSCVKLDYTSGTRTPKWNDGYHVNSYNM